jgi:ACS family pantothenate transporter-like MFS transporter
MKEDLAMNSNELNMIDVAWTCGYVVGQVPSQIILTKVRPSVWIPSCELVWTGEFFPAEESGNRING